MFLKGSDLIKQIFVDVTEQFKKERPLAGLPTGFPAFDRCLGGLSPGEVVVIGGKPGSGKSAFLASIALHLTVATDSTRDPPPEILVFDLETSSYQFFFRMLMACSDVPVQNLRTGILEDEDFRRMLMAAERIHHRDKLTFVDRRHLSVPQLTRLVQQHWARHGLRHTPCSLVDDSVDGPEIEAATTGLSAPVNPALILIDGLQELGLGAECRTRDEEVSRVMSALKTLARSFGCPLVATSRLNRRWDARADPSPRLQDLRDSGSIEDVADVVLLLEQVQAAERERAVGTRPTSVPIDATIAKNRYGSRGQFRLVLDTLSGRFSW